MKNIVVAVIVIVGAIYLFAGNDEQVVVCGKPVNVRIGINSTLKSAPIILADKLGFFKKNGINATLVERQSASSLYDEFFDKKIDVVSGPEHLAAFKSLKRDDFKIFGVVDRNQTHELVARKDSGVSSVKDLKGKKVGLKKASSSIYWLSRLLIYNQLSLNDITTIDGKPAELVKKLVAGELDALISWNPHTYKAMKLLGKNGFSEKAQSGQDMFWTLAADNQYIKDNPQVIKNILRALIEATEYMDSHAQESQEVVAKYLKQDIAYTKYEWAMHKFEVELPQTLIYALESECRWKIKSTETAVPQFLDRIYAQALSELNRDAVTIIK